MLDQAGRGSFDPRICDTELVGSCEKLSIPDNLVLELLTRIDATSMHPQGQPGYHRATHEVYEWVESKIPYIRDKGYRLDTSNALHPTVEVFGALQKPVVGKYGVLEVHEVPKANLLEFFEKADNIGISYVGTYEFWMYLKGLFGIDTTKKWHVSTSPAFYGCILHDPDYKALSLPTAKKPDDLLS